jgi:PPM family protein phosphatase
MLYAAKSHIGLVRQMNQDGFAVHMDLLPYQLVVVADGMGGASAGEVASRLAVESVGSFIAQELKNDAFTPNDLLQSAIHQANQKIWAMAQENDELLGMGTTVVAALFNDREIIFAHVGDSRAYLLRSNGLEQVTKDHSLVAELVRRGQLTEEEALRHPQRSIVTRSLGTLEYSFPDVTKVDWHPGDVMLLCTDGLTNVVTSAELQQHLARLEQATGDADVESVVDDLLRLALERGGPDNITLAIVVHREGGDLS